MQLVQEKTPLVQRSDGEYVRPFDADAALLATVPPEQREAARDRLLARAITVDPGPWHPGDELNDSSGLGAMVVEGLLTRNVDIAGTRSREILGEGDVIRPWDDEAELSPVPAETSWSVLVPTTFAWLDQRFQYVSRQWPEFGADILHRVLRRSRWLAVLLAIASLRGIEERLLLLLWHLAGNWGRVTASGTLVPFGLTHEVMADLVGARRPSVTTALSQLEEAGAVERVDDGWLLKGDPPTSPG